MKIFLICRYLGFKKTILLDRKSLVPLLDMHHNRTLSRNEFVAAVALVHEKRMGQPTHRRVIVDKPKEDDYISMQTYRSAFVREQIVTC